MISPVISTDCKQDECKKYLSKLDSHFLQIIPSSKIKIKSQLFINKADKDQLLLHDRRGEERIKLLQTNLPHRVKLAHMHMLHLWEVGESQPDEMGLD